MIWLQAGTCFVLWIAYGFWMRRSSEKFRQSMHGKSRRVRTLLGSVGLLAGLALLAGGLYAVYVLGGVKDGVMTPLGWIAVAVVGTAFIHMQVLGAAAMITLVLDEETARRNKASISRETEKT